MSSDISVWGMFLAADIVVQIVMIGLVLASLGVWTLLFLKVWEIGAAKKAVEISLQRLKNNDDALYAAANLPSPAVQGFLAEARGELAVGGQDKAALKERVSLLLERACAAESRRIARGVGLLATIGSTAPFVGLFGTVWGIMNSFIGIAQSRTTNLAVVAPGIAEALLATACGLIVAIPAVVIYNMFTRSIAAYRARVADAAAYVQVLSARALDLEQRAARIAAQ